MFLDSRSSQGNKCLGFPRCSPFINLFTHQPYKARLNGHHFISDNTVEKQKETGALVIGKKRHSTSQGYTGRRLVTLHYFLYLPMQSPQVQHSSVRELCLLFVLVIINDSPVPPSKTYATCCFCALIRTTTFGKRGSKVIRRDKMSRSILYGQV